MNSTADTGGFTDHVFAACSILGYAFVPRIRDLPSKRLYVFERAGVPKHLRPLVGGKVNVDLIDRNWADILRVAATMAAGTIRPSQLLRKLAAYPRQNELAAARREVGRIERSLFMIEWTTDLFTTPAGPSGESSSLGRAAAAWRSGRGAGGPGPDAVAAACPRPCRGRRRWRGCRGEPNYGLWSCRQPSSSSVSGSKSEAACSSSSIRRIRTAKSRRSPAVIPRLP